MILLMDSWKRLGLGGPGFASQFRGPGRQGLGVSGSCVAVASICDSGDARRSTRVQHLRLFDTAGAPRLQVFRDRLEFRKGSQRAGKVASGRSLREPTGSGLKSLGQSFQA